ncbi:protein of unknown function [Shewanella benthica]|uniref:Uncharacterized protein n=1 Tax=Shewanella benthica TaxID=43661 RepID=A0A330M102_9GAMM|nr:protein of unknown function [Shewanella benthica]
MGRTRTDDIMFALACSGLLALNAVTY